MHAWPAPTLPDVDGPPGPEVAVWDTRTQSLQPTTPRGAARLYVCGITPYDATHLGHAATFVAFDLLNRAWRVAGHDVAYVQNVTDVDDPLLERANATGEDWRELALRETQLLRDDLTALRVLPPAHFVGAVEAIPLVVQLIDRIRAAGAAYDVEGDLYFSVKADPAFGEVSRLDPAEMLAIFGQRGGDPDRPGKRDPLDCLLWQRARPGEPSWETSLGTGRPGWHIECAAIVQHYLGLDIDVQGGGSDLVFPHHEMSAAEVQVAFPGEEFARAYVHAGMVGLDGDKMSKSLGNLVLVSSLRASGVDPMAIRLALLSQHYRTDWSWKAELLTTAEQRLARWQDAVRRDGPDPTATIDAVRRVLATDLDAPAALAAVDAWALDARPAVGGSGERLAQCIDASLGIALLE